MQRSDKSVLGSLELAQPQPCPAFWTGCDVNGRVDKSLTAPRASSVTSIVLPRLDAGLGLLRRVVAELVCSTYSRQW